MLFRPGLELPASPFTIISKVSCWNAAATRSSLIRDFSNCGHYHFLARPCQVRAGNQKGRIEQCHPLCTRVLLGRPHLQHSRRVQSSGLLWRDQIAHQRPWPGDDSRTVAQAFEEEQSRLLPLPEHPFPTDLVCAVQSKKTIYIRFDLNDYSIPPHAVGRPLTLVASDSQVRILDGTEELACHHRSYDRRQLVLDPAHQQELLQEKRKARSSTPGGRLEQAVPESGALLETAFARGESTHSQTAQLLKLLDTYGPGELREAIREALEHGKPRVSSVAFLLRKYQRSRQRRAPAPVDL